MRVYLKKRHIKIALVVIGVILLTTVLLKLISIWDSKQGSVEIDNIQTTAPPSDDQKQTPSIIVREPTSEEREGLAEGSLTKDELIQDLVDDAVVHHPSEETDNSDVSLPSNDGAADSNQSNQPNQPVQTEYERRIAEIIAEVYVLRDEYIVTLETMYSEAEVALTELVKKDDNEEEAASLVSYYLSKATELEQQCDRQIDIVVVEMEQLIKDNNGDMKLVDTLIETYATEKATKKAWYIDRLEEKGLIS